MIILSIRGRVDEHRRAEQATSPSSQKCSLRAWRSELYKLDQLDELDVLARPRLTNLPPGRPASLQTNISKHQELFWRALAMLEL